MGFLQTEVKEMREIWKEFKDGKIDVRTFDAHMSYYNQTNKRANSILRAMELEAKLTGVKDSIRNNNLLGNEAIDLSLEGVENKVVQCPNNNNLDITLEFCSSIQNKKCKSCEYRKKL